MTRRVCEHCGESYTYAHTCPPPKPEAATPEKLRLVVGKLRDIQRAAEGLAELLEEIES